LLFSSPSLFPLDIILRSERQLCLGDFLRVERAVEPQPAKYDVLEPRSSLAAIIVVLGIHIHVKSEVLSFG